MEAIITKVETGMPARQLCIIITRRSGRGRLRSFYWTGNTSETSWKSLSDQNRVTEISLKQSVTDLLNAVFLDESSEYETRDLVRRWSRLAIIADVSMAAWQR